MDKIREFVNSDIWSTFVKEGRIEDRARDLRIDLYVGDDRVFRLGLFDIRELKETKKNLGDLFTPVGTIQDRFHLIVEEMEKEYLND